MSSPPSRRSQLLLARLHTLPRLTIPAIVLVLTVAGLMAPPPVGVPCLVIVAVFLGWLASLAWPRLDATGRLLRALAVGLLVGMAVARAAGVLD